MTREEEIRQAQIVYIGYDRDIDEGVDTLMRRTAFEDGAKWADEHPVNPYHKYPEEKPPHFGDYIVIIDSNFGRRWTIKCWYGYPKDPFGDNPSKEWLLDDEEKVTYWMEIPNINNV